MYSMTFTTSLILEAYGRGGFGEFLLRFLVNTGIPFLRGCTPVVGGAFPDE
jgi:hypothetical protein